MGKIKEIPYLKEVAMYFLKVIILFFIVGKIFLYFEVFDLVFLLMLVLFLAFSMKFYFLIFFIGTYFGFFYLSEFISSEFAMLFIYLANLLVNTFLILVYIHYFMLKGKIYNID